MPPEALDATRDAVFAAGGGRVGDYERCSWYTDGTSTILGVSNPFQPGRSATIFLEMLPYLLVILVVVIGSREAARKRVGAPAALGTPYVRGERGV